RRDRKCTNPKPSCWGSGCSGSAWQSRSCNTHICCTQGVNGGWSSWGPWGTCSKSCGGGTRTRDRKCTNLPPICGGSNCSGSAWQTQPCNTQTC
ncbi:hypothetical protein BaRGS_00030091, partial [Batillaria attramentaria]